MMWHGCAFFLIGMAGTSPAMTNCKTHSASMPASLIIFAFLTSCTLTNSPSSSGVLENASKPTLPICALIFGSSMILRISVLSRLMMGTDALTDLQRSWKFVESRERSSLAINTLVTTSDQATLSDKHRSLARALADFDNEAPTSDQIVALQNLLAWLLIAWKIPRENISVHKDHAPTTCPGANFMKVLPAILDAVKQQHATAMEKTCSAQGSDSNCGKRTD
jgi:N-acetylmuramoyl-L-alanine amidase